MKKICKECGEFKKCPARGLCNKCYGEKWKLENKEKRKEHQKNYYLKNKEYQKNYYLENKARYKNQYNENSEKRKEYQKKWQRENPEKRRESTLRRRKNGTVKKGVVDKIINENILKYGTITCEKDKKPCPDNFHIDHIRPVSKGGTNDYCNLQILCEHCNHSKYTEIADYRQIGQRQQPFLR